MSIASSVSQPKNASAIWIRALFLICLRVIASSVDDLAKPTLGAQSHFVGICLKVFVLSLPRIYQLGKKPLTRTGDNSV
jgi:hypothetical protein